jgi:hypothetical protein
MLNGQDVFLRLNVQGATTMHKLFGQDEVFIFMVAESEMALVKWLVEKKTESFGNVVCNWNFVICPIIHSSIHPVIHPSHHGLFTPMRRRKNGLQTRCGRDQYILVLWIFIFIFIFSFYFGVFGLKYTHHVSFSTTERVGLGLFFFFEILFRILEIFNAFYIAMIFLLEFNGCKSKKPLNTLLLDIGNFKACICHNNNGNGCQLPF